MNILFCGISTILLTLFVDVHNHKNVIKTIQSEI